MRNETSSPEARKKYLESPKMPMVPGPAMSAKTLTMEKAPLRMPKPSPDTATGKRKDSTIKITTHRWEKEKKGQKKRKEKKAV